MSLQSSDQCICITVICHATELIFGQFNIISVKNIVLLSQSTQSNPTRWSNQPMDNSAVYTRDLAITQVYNNVLTQV